MRMMRKEVTGDEGPAAAAASRRRASAAGGTLDGVSQKKISHIFTHLRKVANHPLLVRHRFTDAKVAEMTALAHKRGLFGATATEAMIQTELSSYSDFALHQCAPRAADPSLGMNGGCSPRWVVVGS